MGNLTVSQVAEIANCHFNTVKNYTNRGVVQEIRDSNNFRRYSIQDALKLKKIIGFRQKAGVPINGDPEGTLNNDFVLGGSTLRAKN